MKIDILHATAGEGHRKIALAIQEGFTRLGPSTLQLRTLDSLKYTDDLFQKTYTPFYYWAVRHAPNLWGWSYDILDHACVYKTLRPLRSLTNSAHTKLLLEDAVKNQPDVIIATHFMPPEILGRAKLKGLIRSKIVTVITDFFPHTFWVNPGTDHYWVMAEETKQELVRRGVPESIITAGGIPVAAAFKPTGRKIEILKKYGLEENRFTLLLTSGSFGLGPQEAILEELKAFKDKVQCFVVCANNKELKAILDAKTYPYPVKIFGFIDFMPDLMEASDLMVAKSGGSTTSEALAKGVAMAVMEPIPGQETRNAKLLKLRDAAFFLKKPEEIRGIVQTILEDPATLSKKRAAIAQLARPNAADDLVKMVLTDG
ncbi:MAG TPA: glycosyltransferase [Candidatus Omnitrophota bacterium]|nr:glycosyltransferase [Candidatus Omnitrophota bacterium]HRY85304.1 glycosyltransferase [Candidatus Omnitrophota bacterium]